MLFPPCVSRRTWRVRRARPARRSERKALTLASGRPYACGVRYRSPESPHALDGPASDTPAALVDRSPAWGCAGPLVTADAASLERARPRALQCWKATEIKWNRARQPIRCLLRPGTGALRQSLFPPSLTRYPAFAAFVDTTSPG